MIRPKIDVDRDSDLYRQIEQYAEEQGVRLPRAYAELLEHAIHDLNTPDRLTNEDLDATVETDRSALDDVDIYTDASDGADSTGEDVEQNTGDDTDDE